MQLARWSLAILLSGYLIFNKPFALLGVGPVYVGELILGVLLLVAIVSARTAVLEFLRRSGWAKILAAFFIYGIVRVAVDLFAQSSAGPGQLALVLRDGVCIGYALYALLLPAAFERPESLATLLVCVAPAALLWTALTFFGYWPTNNAWLVAQRKADMHSLSVVVSAWALGVYAWSQWREVVAGGKPAPQFPKNKPATQSSRLAVLCAILALISAVLAFRLHARAAWLAVVCLVGGLVILNARALLNRYVLGASVFVAGLLVFVAIPYVNHSDSVWAERVRALYSTDYHQMKTVQGVEAQLNIDWRRLFWRRCVEQTGSRAPLTGLGFGLNLTDLMRDTPEWWRYEESQRLVPPNRNPHNASVTIFTRTGLIGLALWWTLLIGTAAHAVQYLNALRRTGESWSAGLMLFGTWLIYVAYMSVGDVLENPFGGIWFWVLTGSLLMLRLPPPDLRETVST